MNKDRERAEKLALEMAWRGSVSASTDAVLGYLEEVRRDRDDEWRAAINALDAGDHFGFDALMGAAPSSPSGAALRGKDPLRGEVPLRGGGEEMNRLTPEEQADQDLAMDWTYSTVQSWRNTYDLILSVRKEERERLARLADAEAAGRVSDYVRRILHAVADAIRSAGPTTETPPAEPHQCSEMRICPRDMNEDCAAPDGKIDRCTEHDCPMRAAPSPATPEGRPLRGEDKR